MQYLSGSKKHRGERRVYQYATGRGGIPIENESPMGDYLDESRVYQYAGGRGGVPLTREDMANYRNIFTETHFGKGPKNWQRSDERIREEACEALYRSYDVDASDIEVEVKDGCVFLRGTVDTRQTKKLAEDVVENISGVKDVQNQLRFERNEPISKHTDSLS